MLSKEEINEKIEKGWIKSRVTFEVMATDEKITEQTLKDHTEKLRGAVDNIVLTERFDKVIEVTPPPRDIPKAFSQIVELELLSKNVEVLLFVVISFAPSSIEILEPKELKVGLQTIQTIMNSVADVMHRFAAQGIGGIVISTKR